MLVKNSTKKIDSRRIKQKARSLALRRNTVTIYVPVIDNIYFDGLSYRVRITRDGVRSSKNFSSIKNALNYKMNLLRGI
jgi:hypothetical protein